ncbi:MAG: hypothetical protein IID18_04865, partial [Nitrospinae bacterium]|nr:hypothetical protein [Nitrospinota bacterium]
VSLGRYGELNEKNFDENLLTVEQRGRYRDRVKNLMAVWSWNGVDFPLFLLAGFSVFGVLGTCLVPLACFLATQFLLTMLYHRMKIRFQVDAEGA